MHCTKSLTVNTLFRKWIKFSSSSLFPMRQKPKLLTQSKVFISQQQMLNIEPNKNNDAFPSEKNTYSYRKYLLENIDRYQTLCTEKNVPDKGTSKTLELLKKINSDWRIKTPDTLNNLTDHMKNELNCVSFEELLGITYLFAKCMGEDDLQYIRQILNDECLKRMLDLTKSQHLQILDALSNSKNFLNYKYTWKKLSKFCNALGKLDVEHTVHVFHLLNRCPKFPTKEKVFQFQICLEKVIPSLNTFEFGILCSALNKMNISITNVCVKEKMFAKIISEIEYTNSQILYSVSCALKNITFSKSSIGNILNLQDSVIPHIGKFDIGCLTNLLLIGIKVGVVNKDLLLKVLKLVKQDSSTLNLLILQRLTHICAVCNLKDDEFLELAMEIFHNTELDPRHSPALVRNLIYLNKYDENAISKVLSAKFLDNSLKGSPASIYSDLLFIDTTLELEFPSYKEPRLDETIKTKGIKVCKGMDIKSARESSAYALMSKKFENICKNIWGDDKVKWMKILVSSYPFIVVRLDKDLNLQPIPKEYNFQSKATIVYPPKDDHIWVPFIFRTSFPMPNSTDSPAKNNCIIQTLCRQLEIIGYNPIVLTILDIRLSKQTNTMEEYISNMIKQELKK